MPPINALIVGTGEYTTGYVHAAPAKSDKSAGVIALTLFDLRRRALIQNITLAGTNGQKFPAIRQHLIDNIQNRYTHMPTDFDSFPSDDTPSNPRAYIDALDTLNPGDAVLIFTPDDTHFDIAMSAIERRCHVLIAKPLVKTIAQHQTLIHAAQQNNVIVAMEVHKRWDPIYADARDRIQQLGHASHFTSFMSQPKSQLDTFAAWAGKASDISYYLNAHHVDFSAWALADIARPISVYATASTGVAHSKNLDTEDTITLTVQWQNLNSPNLATAVYTASWIAPQSDAHTQQHFAYMGHGGQINIDQTHRGYTLAADNQPFASPNPLFMKYTPDPTGAFAGQSAYGYQSIEAFIQAALASNNNSSDASQLTQKLALAQNTLTTTAILEAGRQSLDHNNQVISIQYDEQNQITGLTPK